MTMCSKEQNNITAHGRNLTALRNYDDRKVTGQNVKYSERPFNDVTL